MRLRLHPDALRELREATDWYAMHAGPSVASTFMSAYVHARALVLEHPQIGAKSGKGTRKFSLKRFPYSLVYRSNNIEITLVAIAHQSRKPGYWAKRR